MSKKFTVAEADVRERDGEAYSIDSYKEGEDYVQRKCFKSYKRVFRSDILGATNEESSVVEEQPQASEPVSVLVAGEMQECKIKRLYPNQRWVETDKGRVFVGLKGTTLRVGQLINVLNGELVVKFTGRRKTLVRI
jgi:hypothetical protein